MFPTVPEAVPATSLVLDTLLQDIETEEVAAALEHARGELEAQRRRRAQLLRDGRSLAETLAYQEDLATVAACAVIMQRMPPHSDDHPSSAPRGDRQSEGPLALADCAGTAGASAMSASSRVQRVQRRDGDAAAAAAADALTRQLSTLQWSEPEAAVAEQAVELVLTSGGDVLDAGRGSGINTSSRSYSSAAAGGGADASVSTSYGSCAAAPAGSGSSARSVSEERGLLRRLLADTSHIWNTYFCASPWHLRCVMNGCCDAALLLQVCWSG